MKKAVTLNFEESPKWINAEVPAPLKDEILVEILYCGLCHTDVHAIDGDWPIKARLPLCPGHEGIGKILKLGDEVKGLSVGDIVGIPWLFSTCGYCEYCITGSENLCENQLNTGYNTQGCLTEFIVSKTSHVVKISNSVKLDQVAPILCAGVTSYKAIKVSNARPGQFITILGAAGGLGHLALQYSNAMGLRVIAIDKGKRKVEFCHKFDCELSLDSSKSQYFDSEDNDMSLIKMVREYTQGGSHAVICFATCTSAFELSIKLARKRGNIVFVGIPKNNICLNVFDIVFNCLKIHGSLVGTRQDMKEAMEFFNRGKVECQITTENKENITEAFKRLKENQYEGRCVISMK